MTSISYVLSQECGPLSCLHMEVVYEILVSIQDQYLIGLYPSLGANDVHRDEPSHYINIRREMV